MTSISYPLHPLGIDLFKASYRLFGTYFRRGISPVIWLRCTNFYVSWANDGIEIIAKNKTVIAQTQGIYNIISSFKKFDELKKNRFSNKHPPHPLPCLLYVCPLLSPSFLIKKSHLSLKNGMDSFFFPTWLNFCSSILLFCVQREDHFLPHEYVSPFLHGLS